MGLLKKEIFVCIDCETTGLDVANDRIIEIAAASFTYDQIHEQFDSLIDPTITIPEESIKIHNITQQMVEGKPTIDKILPDILRIIGDKTIVGHGIDFDVEILARAAERAGIATTIRKNNKIDTLRMARHYGESPTNSLQQLRNHFNIAEEGAHRALNDVIVNIEVFNNLSREFHTVEDLMAMLSRPIALKIMPLGKYKGRPLREIPLDYLQYMAKMDFDQDLLYTIRSEIKRRKGGQSFAQAGNPFAGL
jgi:DNA polymerase-3 subunit epsilon